MATITPFREVEDREGTERGDAGASGSLVYLPTLFIVRVEQPTPLEAALERALSRALEPWWRHWLHIGRRRPRER